LNATWMILLIAAGVALKLLWDWRRSGRLLCEPIPRRYRARDSQERIWRERYGQDKLDDINSVLTSFCEAFMFNPEDRFKFAPDDQVMDIYRALYPTVWLAADSMEIETLIAVLKDRFGIDIEVWRPEMSLGDVVEMVAKRRTVGDDTPH
jgi:propanediol dehydratase small subunit